VLGLGEQVEHLGHEILGHALAVVADTDQPKDVREAVIPAARAGAYGLLREWHSLSVLASESHLTLTVLMQAVKALRDQELLAVCEHLDEQTRRQQAWLLTQIKHRAAHTLVVPS
jgi:hypothetical protein